MVFYYRILLLLYRRGNKQKARVTSTAVISGYQAFPVFDAVQQKSIKKYRQRGLIRQRRFVRGVI
jgi:hypothetical protein